MRLVAALLLMLSAPAFADGTWWHTHDDCEPHNHPDVTDDPATWDHVSEPCHSVNPDPPPQLPQTVAPPVEEVSPGREGEAISQPAARRPLRLWRFAL